MEGGGLFHKTMTRFAFFASGATVCYAFANPDEGNVYDIFPSQKSKFAFINRFSVKEQDKWNFEKKWKDLARFYQGQEGYLFNKLVRSKETDTEGRFSYYGIMQWTTGESYIKSTGKTSYVNLAAELPDENKTPLMYKLVVDDTEFDPNESFAPYNTSPGWIMALAFIDPGNIEADLQSGAFTGFSFGYVLLFAHLMGFAIQTLACRIGVVTGEGLAKHCRDQYPRNQTFFLWMMAELAIVASDIQEVIGSSIALNLLFGWPLWLGVLLTGFTTVLFLVMYARLIEVCIMALVGIVFACFSFDFFLTDPDYKKLLAGILVPTLPATSASTMQVVALVGSVVMPHNLFLHSSLIAGKALNRSSKSQLAQAVKYFLLDSALALSISFLINISLQGSFAQAFFSPTCSLNPSGPLGCLASSEGSGTACITASGTPGFCSEIGLSNAGNALSFILPENAAVLFAIGLLAAAQASTVSGTLAGQFVMEGFLDLKVSFWLRMLLTRSVALIPAVAVSLLHSDFEAMNSLSQSLNVVQAIQLPFALLPLLHICGQPRLLGSFALGPKTLSACWLLAITLLSVNMYSLAQRWDWGTVEIAAGLIYALLIVWVGTCDFNNSSIKGNQSQHELFINQPLMHDSPVH